MSGTEWFCGVQLGGVKLPAAFPAARNSKSMVHAGTGRWRQKNGRPMLIVGSRPAIEWLWWKRYFSKAARALRGTRADKVGAETAPKHAPWKAGFTQK